MKNIFLYCLIAFACIAFVMNGCDSRSQRTKLKVRQQVEEHLRELERQMREPPPQWRGWSDGVKHA